MTLDEYKKLLGQHDWFYCYSDDHGVWQRGESSSARIYSLAQTGSDDFKRAYNSMHKRMFNTKHFVSNVRPYAPPFKSVEEVKA